MGTDQDLSWHELILRLKEDRVSAGTSRLSRDERSWLEMSRRVQQGAQIVSLQLRLSSTDAEDLAQSVMLDLQTSALLDRLSSSLSPHSYLQAVLRNRAKDLLRKRQKEQELALESLPELTSQEQLRDIYRAEALRKELQQLPGKDWALVKMRFWDGLSIAEIARRLGEPYSRVAVRLFRLGKRLVSRLEEFREPRRPHH